MDGCDERFGVKSFGYEDVPICGMDYNTSELTGIDGSVYVQVHSNLWAKRDAPDDPIVYLGTGKHGSGIILRPLFVREGGVWQNVVNRKPAPDNIPLSKR